MTTSHEPSTASGRCTDCGNHYDSLPGHWARSDCSHPPLDEAEREVIEAALLAGGWLCSRTDTQSPALALTCKQRPLLDWVAERLPTLTHTIYPTNRDEEGEPTYWRLDTNPHPEFREFQDRWYDGEEKQVPGSIQRTRLTLQLLFAKLGSVQEVGSFRRYYIVAADIPAPLQFFTAYLGKYNPQPYYDTNRETGEESLRRIYIGDVDQFITDIGAPLPGAEDLWPSDGDIIVDQSTLQTTA